MEIEVKYAIPNKETADAIWEDPEIADMSDISTSEKLVMKAVYFDTEDYTLSNHNIALRVRVEGERTFAALKWGGSAQDGFHEREEVNVPVSGEESFIAPEPDMFKESADGLDLIELIGKKPLVNMLETRFLRKRVRLNYKNSIFELAVDTGDIVTDAGNRDILELEIELFAGSEADLQELGERIADKYSLKPENMSKFARGLELIKSVNN
ncbi:MAG: CYTH domain-containing protein [Firmicutes bacterium]|nr:CYTH domain-containing protein [Bacillota bacterium]